MTTTLITMDTVKAALKAVEQKRAIKNRIEKLSETKIAEAKARAEKAYADKLATAETDLEAALATLDATYAAFKNGGEVVVESEASEPAEAEEEMSEAI